MTIRLTNDLASLIRREIAELEKRYCKKLFCRRDRKRRLPSLRESMDINKPPK